MNPGDKVRHIKSMRIGFVKRVRGNIVTVETRNMPKLRLPTGGYAFPVYVTNIKNLVVIEQKGTDTNGEKKE